MVSIGISKFPQDLPVKNFNHFLASIQLGQTFLEIIPLARVLNSSSSLLYAAVGLRASELILKT